MIKPEMNKQEVFDTVKDHLLKQNEVCIWNDDCQYRHNGLKCAIGCLIPDDKYDPKIEGDTIDAEAVSDLLPFKVEGSELRFLGHLQQVHDSYSPVDWLNELEYVAEEHGLKCVV